MTSVLSLSQPVAVLSVLTKREVFWVRLATFSEVAVPNTVEELLVSYQLHCRLPPEGKVAVKIPSSPGQTAVVLPAVGATQLR